MPAIIKLGQHFLANHDIARKIVAALLPCDLPILEVGPGKGALTRLLISQLKGQPLHIVEKDHAFASALVQEFGSSIRLVGDDVLTCNLADLFPAGGVHLISNVPYYLSKDFMDWVLLHHDHLKQCVLMLQKEFVAKLTSPIAQKSYHSQSVLCQLLFSCERLFEVKPGAFVPPPRVQSTVMRLLPKHTMAAGEFISFKRFLQQCFAAPRKMLINNLAVADASKNIRAVFANQSISADARPQDVTPDQYLRVWNDLHT